MNYQSIIFSQFRPKGGIPMRFYISVLLVLATASALMAQKRVLITSDGDAILLKKGESALEAARIQGLIKEGQISSATCGTTTSFGFDDKHYPCNQPFVGYHHDVWGQWFISPSSGTIESLFVYTNDQNDMDGGVGRVRILKSNIYPGHGPGSGPYNVPRHSWGYYKNSNQTDEAFGITPFKGHATDPNWIATNQVYDSITSITGISDGAESFDPLGDELWPGLDDQGFPKTFTINSINSLAMADGPSVPEVAKGDPIFVTIEQIGSHHAPQGNNADAATWCMSNSGIPAIPVNWKFYEHKTGGTFGWHARAEASWMWWIVMNVTGDVPPDILYMDRLPHTLSTGARTVNANIQDCNPGHPDTAGVASVSLTYSVDGGSNSAHAMINDVGDHYYFTIPGQSAGSYVNYTITCTDIKGNVKTLGPITYEVVPMRNVYYVTDTSAAYSWA